MNPQKQELLKKLGESQNILVTVSANPSVDQLSACIGVTLLLNKLKKHATAVFSGEVPSTIEFLKPEQTLEKNTDSLRDFIISLDKSKADKLRYKVEDQVVRIFITPYRTSISDKDLEYSQGDFNVDVVLCLGVSQQQDLDQAITSHGRILHDAVVVSINTQPGGELGTINWTEPTASSLSELVTELSDSMGQGLLDAQIATAMLTGIVAETERFSNEKTSPETMRLSAVLMSAGANQQLVASELAAPEPEPLALPPEERVPDAIPEPAPAPVDQVAADGTLEISHQSLPDDIDDLELPEPLEPEDHDEAPLTTDLIDDEVEQQAHDQPDDEPSADEQTSESTPESEQPVDETPDDATAADGVAVEVPADSPESSAYAPDTSDSPPPASRMVLQPPTMGGTLTANSTPDQESLHDVLTTQPGSNSTSFLNHQSSGPSANPLLGDDGTSPPPHTFAADLPITTPTDPVASDDTAADAEVPVDETLSQLETSVASPHLDDQPPAGPPADPTATVDAARDAVMSAINSEPSSTPLPPVQSSGAGGYLDVQNLPPSDINSAPAAPAQPAIPDLTEAAAVSDAFTQPLPAPQLPSIPTQAAPPAADSPAAPPVVPPPLPLNDLNKFITPSQQ